MNHFGIKQCWNNFKQSGWISYLEYDGLLRPFFILCIIYYLAITALVRANFNYIDDQGRVLYGYREWVNFSRYLSEYLSVFVNFDKQLTDISPITQFIAIVILSLASIILIHLFCGARKVSMVDIIAIVPLGINPYFMECMAYKFDSPYMALSILGSVFPFIFINNARKFFVTSIIGVLIMCNTYQAASGIYVLVVLFKLLLDWIHGTNWKLCIRKGILAAVAYVLAILIFRLCFMHSIDTYVGTQMAPLNTLFWTIGQNAHRYVKLISQDFPKIWKIVIAVLTVSFVISAVWKSRQNKLISAMLTILLLSAGLFISYGGYMALVKPLWATRAFYGFGVFLALIALSTTALFKEMFDGIPLKIGLIALTWCFFVFASTFGNALAEQKHYTDFRTNLAVADLNRLYNGEDGKKRVFQIQGNIGKSLVVERMGRRIPVLNRLVPSTLGQDWIWSEITFYQYYHLQGRQANPKKNEDLRKLDLPIVLKTPYHTIKSDGKNYLIILR